MNAPVAFDMNRASLDTQKCSKIVEVSRCRALMVSSELKINKVSFTDSLGLRVLPYLLLSEDTKWMEQCPVSVSCLIWR